jgi:hypothetical protein
MDIWPIAYRNVMRFELELNMNKNKKHGTTSLLLVFLGSASILASLGVVGINPPEREAKNEIALNKTVSDLSEKSVLSSLPPLKKKTLPGDISWDVEILGVDIVNGKEVEILEFYPADLNLWRSFRGGKAYRSLDDGQIIALKDRMNLSGNLLDRFVMRTEETEETFRGLPLGNLETKM